jgi:1-acyl-sn-glycerol-3-phosphate acyltransferase
VRLFRSIFFNACFFLWSTLVSVCATPFFLGPRLWTIKIACWWGNSVMFLARAILGLHYEIRGRENLPPLPFILASKHQSAWDTIIFYILFADPIFILKRELHWIPFFGWGLKKTGSIGIDRKAGAKALKGMLAEAKEHLTAGRPIVIFPEGTRTAPGAKKPYQPGVAAIYTQCGVPVVPVALNSGMFWRRREFIKRPGTIVLEFLPTIEPGLDRRAFQAELEKRIEEGSNRLMQEALEHYPQLRDQQPVDNVEK